MLRKTSNKRLIPIPAFLRVRRLPTVLSAKQRLCYSKNTAFRKFMRRSQANMPLHILRIKYEKKTDHIINRLGTDMCPMEEAVLNVNDADDGENLIKDTIKSMMKG